MAGDTNVAVRRGFTVQRVHRTQCRLVCTRRDLGAWAGPVGQVGAGPVGGWVGLMEHPLLRHISPAASRITVEKNRTLINVML